MDSAPSDAAAFLTRNAVDAPPQGGLERKLEEAENRLKEFKLRHMNLASPDGKDYYGKVSEVVAILAQARPKLTSSPFKKIRSLVPRLPWRNAFSSGKSAEHSRSQAVVPCT